jgi:flagellin
MSLIINTNISSLMAQNNLTKSQSALSQATERLSSGLKINSAADNAAGFAISQQYTTRPARTPATPSTWRRLPVRRSTR